MFEGVTVALVTPFREGEVDFEKIEELIEWHVAEGTDCILPCGTTGESPTLSHQEHDEVVDAVIRAAAGRAKVIAGAGSNSTAEAVRLTCHAADSGADGALVIVPYYNKPTQEGMYWHFRAVAEAADIPIVIYNVPGRTGASIAPETVIRLSEIDNIVAIKEASGIPDQASAIIAGCDVTVLSGDDSLTLPLMAVGGKGVISVLANIAAADLKAMVAAFNSGDVTSAVERHGRLFGLCRAMFLETNPIPVKTAMKMLGRLNGQMRLPLCEMSDANQAKLKVVLQEYGLLEG